MSVDPSAAGLEPPRMTRERLADGYRVARIVTGCWQLAEGHRTDVSASGAGTAVGADAVLEALDHRADAGMTTFDCADIYTGVETLLGRLIATRRAAGKSAIEVHTKWVPDRSTLGGLTRFDAEQAIDRSLRRLGVECLDLVQFHWWDFSVDGWVEALIWLDDLRRAGKIHHIGVTNFDAENLAPALAAGVPVVSNQVQLSVLDRRPLRALVTQAKHYRMHLLTYGSLAGGFLTSRWLGRPAPVEPLVNRSLVKYRLIIDEVGGWTAFQSLLRALARVAETHDTRLAVVATAWVLAQSRVAAAIVGGVDPRYDTDLLRAATLELTDRDRVAIDAAMEGLRPVPGEVYGLERETGGRHAVIMKTELNRRDRGAS